MQLCNYYDIPVAKLNEVDLDWSFDGTDECDKNNNLIKGQGAAMFKEKLNFVNAPKVYILADKTKFVDKLCQNYPIPIECDKDAEKYVISELLKLNVKSYNIRNKDEKTFITENGNIIIDAFFEDVSFDLEKRLKLIVGVIETGLFMGYENIEVLK